MPANLARQNVATTAAEREFWRPATGAVWAAAEWIMAVGERSWLQSAGIPCELHLW
ncbi:MAG: hypothetical protein WBO08_18180 [Mycobacterium sp.]